MTNPNAAVVASMALSLTALLAQAPAGDDPAPLALDVVERTERRLVQLDVSLEPRGKPGVGLPELAADQLELVIAGRRIEIRYLDRVCGVGPTAQGQAAEAGLGPRVGPPGADHPGSPPPLPGTFVFYLEHKLLTIGGQQNALRMAQSLIPKLVVNGARGMIVSSGRRLLQSDLTSDVDSLLEALERIEGDPDQWTDFAYAEAETARLARLVRGRLGATTGDFEARRYQQQELRITDRRLRRFAAAIGSLAELDPPKAVIYFADIVRKRPGEHYAAFAGSAMANVMRLDSFAAQAAFDRVTEAAGSHGVRLYTIQARGWTYSAPAMDGGRSRIEQAEQTLADFALETGGATFKGGTDRATIGRVYERVRGDLGCFYLLSFYPDDLALDRKLPVRVRFNPDAERVADLEAGFRVRNRGQIVLQSEGRRKQSRLVAAHLLDGAADAAAGHGAVIPLGFDDGLWTARVQLRVTNPDLPPDLARETDWELGLSHVFRERVERSVAARVQASEPNVAVVLEVEWGFRAGNSGITGIAYENQLGQLVTADFDTTWPDPGRAAVTISPIALVQPARGVFLRKSLDGAEELAYEGSIAIGAAGAEIDRPVQFVSVVCRGRKSRGKLWVDRELGGDRSVDFELRAWADDDGERCIRLQDRVEPEALGGGVLRYTIRVYDDPELTGKPLAERARELDCRSTISDGDPTLE